jgi:hypothetical protein
MLVRGNGLVKPHITLLLAQNVLFLVLYLVPAIQFYSYSPPHLFLDLLTAFVFIILFYVSWIGQENEMEAETSPSQPIPTNLLIFSLLMNIFFIIITIFAFTNSSSIEFAITEVFFVGGWTTYFINGTILSLYIPTLLKNRRALKENQSN